MAKSPDTPAMADLSNMAVVPNLAALPDMAATPYRALTPYIAAVPNMAVAPFMTAVPNIELEPGSILTCPAATYVVQSILGSGTYGKVVLCEKDSKKKVAIKFMKCIEDFTTIQEINILRDLSSKGGEQNNIISLMSSFMFEGHHCLEFEHLDISLFDLQEECGPLHLHQIRPILQQLASGLKFLRDSHVVHGDLKAQNVMMVDHMKNLQVKIIDFGLAKRLRETRATDVLQTLWYRAPEVLLGLVYNTAVDLWSLGCMAAEMLLGEPLFPGSCEHDMLRHISDTVALPPDDLLEKGLFTENYFQKNHINGANIWKLKPMTGMCPEERTVNSLEDLFTRAGLKTGDEEDEELDCKLFVDLVTELLRVDPHQRMSAERVLEHPFISMSHMEGVFITDYTTLSVEMMRQNTGRSVEDVPSTSSSLQGASQPLGQVKKTSPASTKAQGVPLKNRDEDLCSSSCALSAASRSRKRKREEAELSDPIRTVLEPKRFKKTECPQELPPSNKGLSTLSGSRKRKREEEPLSDSHSSIHPPKRFRRAV